MEITREEVLKIAELARLYFDEAEIESFTEQFRRILEYVAKLSEVEVEGVEPTSHVSLATGVNGLQFRQDEPGVSLEVEEALSGAPESGEGHFKVPRVL